MKQSWKAVVLAACVLLFCICAGGCGTGQSNHPDNNKKARMQITIAFWDAEESLVGDAVLDEIETRFEVEFVPVNMTWNDHYQKMDRWAMTNSLPDLFAADCRNSSAYAERIDRGQLHEIPADLSAYPHLDAYMETILEQDQVNLVDGRLYCIPRRTYPSQAWTCIDRVVAYRWDLAQQAGITKEPETWQEFKEMMLAILQKDPENTGIRGLTTEDADLLSGWILPYASKLSAAGGNNFFWYADKQGIYRPAYMTDDLLPAFQLARDMYTAGVIEPETILQTRNSAKDKFLRGENAAILYSGGFGGIYTKDLEKMWTDCHGGSFLEDVKMLALMPDVNGTKAYPIWRYCWSESCISATVMQAERF